jgi:hypothetical protein
MALLGTPGIQVGYAGLEFRELSAQSHERIEIEARVASASKDHHIVDYRADAVGADERVPGTALVARARGLTSTPR